MCDSPFHPFTDGSNDKDSGVYTALKQLTLDKTSGMFEAVEYMHNVIHVCILYCSRYSLQGLL